MTIAKGVGPANPSRDDDENNTGSMTLNGCTAGRTVVGAVIFRGTTQTVSSLTCSGETVNLIGSIFSTGLDSRIQMFYTDPLASGGNKTFNLTLSAAALSLQMNALELYGDGDVVLDVNGSGTGTGSHSITLTGVADNAAIVAFATSNQEDPDTNPGTTPLTYVGIPMNNTNQLDGGEYVLDAGSAGNKTVNFNIASGTWGIKAASFVESGGGGPAVPVIASNYYF